ncbi:MAG: hypothetical protein KIH65_002010 [Candidatus Uhrbacteria bacterium]|nr:hypothetical protein [Candidatus Uhrbacteria bacterium]
MSRQSSSPLSTELAGVSPPLPHVQYQSEQDCLAIRHPNCHPKYVRIDDYLTMHRDPKTNSLIGFRITEARTVILRLRRSIIFGAQGAPLEQCLAVAKGLSLEIAKSDGRGTGTIMSSYDEVLRFAKGVYVSPEELAKMVKPSSHPAASLTPQVPPVIPTTQVQP